jgi:hypothetical protein
MKSEPAGFAISADAARDNARKLFAIKLVHTLIWAMFVLVIGYTLYAGLADEIGMGVAIAIGAVVIEGIVLMLNRGSCPLTNIAARYSEKTDDSFDIFLPEWLAKNNKLVFGSIWLLSVALVVYRALT